MSARDVFLSFVSGQGKNLHEIILVNMPTVRIGAQPAVITSPQYFKDGGVATMNEVFKTQFVGLHIPAAEPTEMVVHWTGGAFLNSQIFASFRDRVEISVSQFMAFLAQHWGSQQWYVFYLRGKDGNFWAVSADWGRGPNGWMLHAEAVVSPRKWRAGGLVVASRLSSFPRGGIELAKGA